MMKDALNKAGHKTGNTSVQQRSYQKQYNNKDNKAYSGHKNNSSQYISGGKNHNNRNDKDTSEGYVGAPYNFVSIPLKVFSYKNENKGIPTHNQMYKELLSGSIGYTVKAQTPIMVGSGIKEDEANVFYKNSKGQYAIPGSTIRGLIRSNMQTCSFSSFFDDIADYKLMFRNVASGADRGLYNRLLVSNRILKVKAGYITKVEDNYVIYNTCVDRDDSDDMNFYVISERYINQHIERFNYLYSEEFSNTLQPKIDTDNSKKASNEYGNNLQYKKGTKFEEYKDKKGQKHFRPENKEMFNGTQNGTYRPFYAEVSYETKNNRISSIDAPEKLSKKGFLMGTGAMVEKKALYVIPSIDKSSEPQVIDKASREAYKIDYNARLNNLGDNKEFYSLPENNEVRPIFYMYLEEMCYLGYTPRLRLFYKRSIIEGLRQDKCNLDYVKALFGYIGEKDSYKSRLSFVDAYTENGKEMDEVRYIMDSPKPTSYLDYLKQEGGKTKTYNDKFELRGVKHYWNIKETRNTNVNKNNWKVSTGFKPLESGTEFHGSIRFKNLTKDELGLLLFCLEPDAKANHNIGMGKAYGYGRIVITCTNIQLFDLKKAYATEAESFMTPFITATDNKQEYINEYKTVIDKWISANYPGIKFVEFPTIKEFISMKTEIMKEELTRYMNIDDGEYQKRMSTETPLPTVDELIEANRK